MNCWDILGIEPTDNRERIRQAYEQQMKFASDHEAEALRQAYQEATGARDRQSLPAQATNWSARLQMCFLRDQ